jgi:hypothetical protein
MWVRFTDDFDFSPAERNGRVTIAYKAGMLQNVTRECAGQAIPQGKARIERIRSKARAHGQEGERR